MTFKTNILASDEAQYLDTYDLNNSITKSINYV